MRNEKNSAYAVTLILLLLTFIAAIVAVSGFIAYRRLAQGLAIDPPAPPGSPAELLPPGTIVFPPNGIVTFEELYSIEDADFLAEIDRAAADIQYFIDKPTMTDEEVDALNAATKNLETITELYRDRVRQRVR